MATHDPRSSIDFAGPAAYRIVVQGVLSQHWRERLAGFTIETAEGPGQAPRTTLFGRMRDQAELNGVLETLYGLHLPILAVQTVED